MIFFVGKVKDFTAKGGEGMEKLDYRKLIQGFMQLYEMTAERSKRIFLSILAKMQKTEEGNIKKGGEKNGAKLERVDTRGEKGR